MNKSKIQELIKVFNPHIIEYPFDSNEHKLTFSVEMKNIKNASIGRADEICNNSQFFQVNSEVVNFFKHK